MAQAVPFILQGASSLVQGGGAYRAGQFEAEQSKRAGEIARVQADQIDAQYRDELRTTLSNIRAIRASAGGGADSPSTLAVMAEEERVSRRQRRIEVGGRRMQASQHDSDAAIKRSSARWALGGAVASSMVSFAKAKAA